MGIAIQQKGVERLVKYLDQQSSGYSAVIRKELGDTLERCALLVERNVKEDQMRGNAVFVRSGALRRSVRRHVDKKQLEAAVGTNMVYGRLLEVGGTIRPKNAKVLTIPLDAAKTAAGRSRGGPREVGRLYDDTFWKRVDGGPLILYGVKAGSTSGGWRAQGKHSGPRLVPLFIGVPSATIPSKGPFRKAAAATGGQVRVQLEQAARIITEGK